LLRRGLFYFSVTPTPFGVKGNPLDLLKRIRIMEFIIVTEQYAPYVALIQLNRPKELNALNRELMEEVRDALRQLDKNENVRVIIITGNDQAFAAGADIKQLSDKSAVEMLMIDQFSTWDQIRRTRKPIIAAVSGFVLGGGCEFAMLCDMIVASETAKFGQPEIKIGTMPGAGGTQRLTKALGKAKSMELILTGRFLSADEACARGLINKVVPIEMYLQEAVELAKLLAISGCPTAEAINRSFETQLEEDFSLNEEILPDVFRPRVIWAYVVNTMTCRLPACLPVGRVNRMGNKKSSFRPHH
jgi:enoyl-CoA hydratase